MLPQVEQIAARVRELRTILDVEADDIAEKIGVSRETYDEYEAGTADIPVGKLYLIATELHVDPTVLLLGDEPRMVDYTLIRGGNGLAVERYAGYKFTSLAYNYIDREMERGCRIERLSDGIAPLVEEGFFRGAAAFHVGAEGETRFYLPNGDGRVFIYNVAADLW